MSLRLYRLVAVILAALTLGMGFCHLLEMPVRLGWDQKLWVDTTVHGGLYDVFGAVGAVIVVATVASTTGLAWAVRKHARMVYLLSLASAVLFATALAAWWALVFPVNMEMATWLNGPVPDDWDSTRLRWETGHAVNTVIQFFGFTALVCSILVETPEHPGKA